MNWTSRHVTAASERIKRQNPPPLRQALDQERQVTQSLHPLDVLENVEKIFDNWPGLDASRVSILGQNRFLVPSKDDRDKASHATHLLRQLYRCHVIVPWGTLVLAAATYRGMLGVYHAAMAISANTMVILYVCHFGGCRLLTTDASPQPAPSIAWARRQHGRLSFPPPWDLGIYVGT